MVVQQCPFWFWRQLEGSILFCWGPLFSLTRRACVQVLITDEVTVKVLSACVKMTDIQDEGISGQLRKEPP